MQKPPVSELVRLAEKVVVGILYSTRSIICEGMMKTVLLTLVFSAILTVSVIASETTELYVCNPGCCEFTCVLLDIECCGWCDGQESLHVQFMDADDNIIGYAEVEDWCNGCSDEHFVTLDAPVSSQEVVKILVTKPSSDCCFISWMSVKALCESSCCNSSWTTLWKGTPYGWSESKCKGGVNVCGKAA